MTDCAASRICRYADISAYGLFRHPLFTQHKFPDGGHRLPELFAYNGRAGLEERFPNPTALTRVLLPDEPRRFWVLSNAPGKDLNRLALAQGDALVFLNRAVDWPQAQGLPLRKIALCRRNARSKGEWFLLKAGGLEGFDDMLLLTDRVVEAEHAWMKDYRHATGYHPTTGGLPTDCSASSSRRRASRWWTSARMETLARTSGRSTTGRGRRSSTAGTAWR